MRRKSSRRRRDDSDSGSSSSYSDDSSKKSEDLHNELKNALTRNDKYAYQLIRTISKGYKHDFGILRMTIGGSFCFEQNDMEEFFGKFGKIENVIIKQNNSRVIVEDPKPKEQESIAYIIYSDYFSAVLALKVINSVSEKQRIVKVQICSRMPQTSIDKNTAQPLLNSYKASDMLIEVQTDYQFGDITKDYKYVGTIGLDLTDKNFKTRERILGVDGCNFVRIYYLCDKNFRFENENEQFKQNELLLKLIVNKTTGSDREVLVLSHSLQKYNHAIRNLHELMEQIVEEYKNSREKSTQIIPKDVHIRKWEKFSFEPQLKFLT